MRGFGFTVLARDKKTNARVGEIRTAHGVIRTPAFVPVGTQASVKSLTPEEIKASGTQLFFVNTYHMYLRPGIEVIEKLGGLHRFMGWDGPIITDSGGFQVFSLPHTKMNDEGVAFQSHWDGSRHVFTPEKSIEVQRALGADITLAFDDCTPYPVTHGQAARSLSRTHQWAKRSLAAHKTQQALYGVVQGSVFENLRNESANYISSLDFDGIAIGGVAVGETKKEMRDVLDWVTPLLPQEKPRHLLGVGEIDDIFALVERGIDTFDCVGPTRLARMGHLYTISNLKFQISNLHREYQIDINKKTFSRDEKPIDENCQCYTCRHFSRAYIHHLFRVKELLAYRLATIHNLWFIHRLVDEIRQSITDGRLLALKKKWL